MEDILDFSQESDLKERLWEKMQSIVSAKAPKRVEVGFDALGGGSKDKPKTVKAESGAAEKNKPSKGIKK